MLSDTIKLEELGPLLREIRSDRLLCLADVAERLEVPPRQVRRWTNEGILPAERVGGQPVFRLADIALWEVEGQVRLRDLRASSP